MKRMPAYYLFLLMMLMNACIYIDRSDRLPEQKLPENVVARHELPDYDLPGTKEGYLLAAQRVNPLEPTTENREKGKKLYEQYCTHCHGKNGSADAPMIAKEKYPPPPPFQKRLPTITEGQMFHSIYYGKNQMPENKKDLTPTQIWLIVAYIKTFITPTDSLKP
ncbi:MAG TPA: cytochrome c [Bacteroidia bacterium]|nr:cytochrome c [Bacteroidia bacterium]HRU67435.1 cytochrome c [Bacteroidia bacterium]